MLTLLAVLFFFYFCHYFWTIGFGKWITSGDRLCQFWINVMCRRGMWSRRRAVPIDGFLMESVSAELLTENAVSHTSKQQIVWLRCKYHQNPPTLPLPASLHPHSFTRSSSLPASPPPFYPSNMSQGGSEGIYLHLKHTLGFSFFRIDDGMIASLLTLL